MPTKPLSIRYEDDLRLLASRWRQAGTVLVVLLGLVYPLYATNYWLTLGNAALVAIVGSVALMILTGFTGQISLGHAAFMALGAYTAASLGVHLGWPWWLVTPLGGVVAAAAGLAVGPFELRYAHQLFYLYLVIVIAVVLFATHLRRSRTGRAMAAVRDRDVAAAVMGIDVARTKFEAFGISSFLAGVAGAMFAFQQQFITIDPPFNLFKSIEYIAMIVLGGIGTVVGAVIGAITFVTLGPLAEGLLGELPLVSNLSSSQQQQLLFAVIVGIFLVVEPLGLYGVWLRIKAYFMAWPFRY